MYAFFVVPPIRYVINNTNQNHCTHERYVLDAVTDITQRRVSVKMSTDVLRIEIPVFSI